jgi:hypothetical protein
MKPWGRARDGKVGAPTCLVVAAAAAVAIVSARDYAGGWNDGSRLATVESLVDYHTLAIDRSIFVVVPPRDRPGAPVPYRADEPNLLLHGTQDKLFIRGHFYSDKSPVPALWMAGVYQALQWGTGLKARERPDRFCYWMTLLSSGLAYVIAVWCMFRLGRPLRLPPGLRLGLAASLGLSTVALTYVRQVNNHILLLAVAAALYLGLASWPRDAHGGRITWLRLLGLGTLAGLAYTIDLGAGPVLLACALGVVCHRCRSLRRMAVFAGAALPWLALHHVLNYTIGGTFRPANAVPAYFTWPGSPFAAQNMTGILAHSSIGHFLIYAAALLAGKRGFLGHNLPLFLAAPGIVILLRRRTAERPEILSAGCWFAGTWLVCALFSNNYSGVAASIRWFVPLLVPGYFVLAILLREDPRFRWDFLALSAWGAVLAGLMWWKGPWLGRMVPFFWPIQAAALVSWIVCWRARRNQNAGTPPIPGPAGGTGARSVERGATG